MENTEQGPSGGAARASDDCVSSRENISLDRDHLRDKQRARHIPPEGVSLADQLRRARKIRHDLGERRRDNHRVRVAAAWICDHYEEMRDLPGTISRQTQQQFGLTLRETMEARHRASRIRCGGW